MADAAIHEVAAGIEHAVKAVLEMVNIHLIIFPYYRWFISNRILLLFDMQPFV